MGADNLKLVRLYGKNAVSELNMSVKKIQMTFLYPPQTDLFIF